MATKQHKPQKLLTVSEVAQQLRLSKWSVYRRISEGSLPAVRVGSSPRAPLRVDATELAQYVYGDDREAA